MTENSASLGVLPRASPTRNEPTSRGGVSTTFQAGQSLPMCANLRRDKAVIWRMSVNSEAGEGRRADRMGGKSLIFANTLYSLPKSAILAP
jgi:hypothetical protein